MTKLILLGAGKIGETITHFLQSSGDYALTVADQDEARLAPMAALGAATVRCEFGDPAALRELIRGHEFVISACPFHLTPVISAAAVDVGAHYFDLTEDVESTRRVKALAANAKTALVPQCGLAPGFISILAHAMAAKFDTLRDVQMRVGALPVYPTNALKYNLTWSTDGLINEYCNPCEAIIDGKLHETLALEEVEALLARRRRLRGVQHVGRARHAVRDARRQGREPQLQDRALSRPPRHREDADPRPAAGPAARDPEGRARGVGADDAPGRRAGVRHRQRHARRPPDAGIVRQEDLQQDDRRQAVFGDPDDHRRRHLRDGRYAARGQAAASAASCGRKKPTSTRSWPTASASITPDRHRRV